MKLSTLVQQIEADYFKPQPIWKTGAEVCIDVFIQEGNKQRIQSYTGTIIAQHKAGVQSTITVRRLSKGIEIERIFPINCPHVKAIKPIIASKRKKKKKKKK